jgi:hypothetical protein
MLRPAALSIAVLVALGSAGCGTMKLRQVQYLSVPSGTNTNYYRTRVYAKTVLGDAEFRSGWFPTGAVDSLFGDVSPEGSTAALKVREDIRGRIDAAYQRAIQDYLDAVQAGKSPAELTTFLDRIRAVRVTERCPRAPSRSSTTRRRASWRSIPARSWSSSSPRTPTR